ncbi:unnamed protein product [Orchesella dallaii]|uniref:MACPF domain-containing protein n=1 Tax=Orchesella dallaii TaxID=48710 RepID=A0ABP1Q3W0_9HEXA
MKYMFLNLPEQFESNELLYYQFINTFGTGVITSTVFGGKIQVWATRDSLKTAILNTNINNIATLNPLLNRIIKLATLKTIHIEGGGFPGSKTAKDMFHWKKQIMMSPVSLQPNVMPINKFLDPSLNSAPSKGLAKIVKFEEQNHKLRRVLYALNSFESGRLFDFLKTNLALEITKVCPSQSLYSVIKRGILDEANVNLMKYVVICTHHSEYSDKYEQRVIFSRFYKLLPGLCLSITGNPPPCASSSFQAQTGITCLQFFKNRKCNEPVHMVVKNANESKRAFNSGSKSFKFCN